MKPRVYWSEEEQDKLLQFYQKYGKQFCKISEDLGHFFYDQQKFTSGRVNSKILSLYREGMNIILNRCKDDHSFVKSIEHLTVTKVIYKINTIPNNKYFQAKCDLLNLRNNQNSPKEVIYEIKDMINYALGKQPRYSDKGYYNQKQPSHSQWQSNGQQWDNNNQQQWQYNGDWQQQQYPQQWENNQQYYEGEYYDRKAEDQYDGQSMQNIKNGSNSTNQYEYPEQYYDQEQNQNAEILEVSSDDDGVETDPVKQKIKSKLMELYGNR